ncbi:zinc-finger protein [Podila clonocystis]|nr:zinc-finger protein [Podila clonocystis]
MSPVSCASMAAVSISTPSAVQCPSKTQTQTQANQVQTNTNHIPQPIHLQPNPNPHVMQHQTVSFYPKHLQGSPFVPSEINWTQRAISSAVPSSPYLAPASGGGLVSGAPFESPTRNIHDVSMGSHRQIIGHQPSPGTVPLGPGVSAPANQFVPSTYAPYVQPILSPSVTSSFTPTGAYAMAPLHQYQQQQQMHHQQQQQQQLHHQQQQQQQLQHQQQQQQLHHQQQQLQHLQQQHQNSLHNFMIPTDKRRRSMTLDDMGPVKQEHFDTFSFSSSSTHSTPTAEDDIHACHWRGCSETFPSFSTLTNHLSEVHIETGKSEYICDWVGCDRRGRGFGQRQKAMRHIQTHTGDKPFQCSECSKRFSEANIMAQHMRTHTGEKPFKCPEPGCGRQFSISGALTIHKRVHTGEKPFKCRFEGCNKWFAESSNLTKHLRIHTGEKPFLCPYVGCGRLFSRPDQVTRHKRSHMLEGDSLMQSP